MRNETLLAGLALAVAACASSGDTGGGDAAPAPAEKPAAAPAAADARLPGRIFSQDRWRGVRGAVVQRQDPQFRQGLAQQAVELFGQKIHAIVAGEDDVDAPAHLVAAPALSGFLLRTRSRCAQRARKVRRRISG